MATYTYLDMNGLRTYDGLIKQYISDADALAIKFGKIENGILKLYKVASPAEGATPDFSLTLPISNFIEKVNPATAQDIAILNADGTLADGGSKIADLETKAHAGDIPNGATASTIVGYAAEVASDAEANSAVTVVQNGLVVTLYQGGNTAEDVIGTINIPADMVVQSGEVVKYEAGNLPDGVEEAGTYLVLTLANASGQKIYINVADLIDTYTAAQNATQIQVAVNGRVISASVVAGSIDTAELADGAVTTAKLDADAVTNAKLADDAVQTENIVDANVTAAKLASDSVTTAKIVDGNVTTDKIGALAVTSGKLAADSVITAKIADENVTMGKLAQGVQTSLGLADTALQSGDFATISSAEIESLFD